ncbi:BnaCnng21810D [Brassica napus]|uniref:(rape) hypothetical protein n=1 Tax=Brassica napus TaxID=3708 RepID=A0A078ILZ3_BRANA|nr:unnamed protein product [Brassica napus]CDY52080.1 BnaCnng21810D [Brassica napus]
MEVRCRRSKTSPQNRQVHGGYSSPFRSRGKLWVCPLNLCFQNSHILETSQLLTNKGLPCLLMLETRKRGSQRFATKTPYYVTEWRSSKDLNLGPTMLNKRRNRKAGGSDATTHRRTLGTRCDPDPVSVDHRGKRLRTQRRSHRRSLRLSSRDTLDTKVSP